MICDSNYCSHNLSFGVGTDNFNVLCSFVANIFVVGLSYHKLYAHLKLGFEFAFPLETSNKGHPLNEQPVSLGHLKIGSSNAFFVAWKDIFHSINSYKFYKLNYRLKNFRIPYLTLTPARNRSCLSSDLLSCSSHWLICLPGFFLYRNCWIWMIFN